MSTKITYYISARLLKALLKRQEEGEAAATDGETAEGEAAAPEEPAAEAGNMVQHISIYNKCDSQIMLPFCHLIIAV